MKNATAIGALLCEAWFGKAGAKVFDILMFVSVMAYVNVVLLSNPRVMYAMSMDKVFPKIFADRNEKTGALTAGLTVFSLITIAVSFLGKGVDPILNFSMFLDCIGMGSSAAALFILRNRQNKQLGGFTRFTPFFAAFFILAYLVIATGVFIKDLNAALTGTGLLVLFLALYFIFYHRRQ
jgi:APA family basic amino acid/polyamine antiporter